jgi:hypothetical protein
MREIPSDLSQTLYWVLGVVIVVPVARFVWLRFWEGFKLWLRRELLLTEPLPTPLPAKPRKRLRSWVRGVLVGQGD